MKVAIEIRLHQSEPHFSGLETGSYLCHVTTSGFPYNHLDTERIAAGLISSAVGGVSVVDQHARVSRWPHRPSRGRLESSPPRQFSILAHETHGKMRILG